MDKALRDTAGTRGTTGVVATIVPLADGNLRLIFDDVVRANESDNWATSRLFTFHDFDNAAFLRSALSQETLANIGLPLSHG